MEVVYAVFMYCILIPINHVMWCMISTLFQRRTVSLLKPLSPLPPASNKITSVLTALFSPSRRNRSHDYPQPSITRGCGRTPGSACWELWFTTILRPIPGSRLYLSPFLQSADNSQLIVLICVARSATSLSGYLHRPATPPQLVGPFPLPPIVSVAFCNAFGSSFTSRWYWYWFRDFKLNLVVVNNIKTLKTYQTPPNDRFK